MNNMKKQGKKMIQTILYSMLIETNDTMVEEMSENDFWLYTIKMIQEAKDEIREQMQAINDNSNKQEELHKAKDHFNKQI